MATGEGPIVMRRTVCALAVGGVLLLASCGGGGNPRTVENFCSHYRTDKARYLAKYDAEARSVSAAQDKDPLAGLIGLTGMSFQMLGSVEQIFDDLAGVAPVDIQPQVEQVRDSVKKQEDQLSQENPLGAGSILSTLLGSLETSLESSDAWQQVGDYVGANCEAGNGGQNEAKASGTPSSGAAGATTGTAPTPAATGSSAAGNVLATVRGDGRVNVVSNPQGQGFTVVDSILDGDTDASFLQAYDSAGAPLAKLPAGSVTGECGAADVSTGQGRLLLAEKIDHHEAQGIQSATDTLNLSAYKADSGERMWTVTLVRDATDGIGCSAYGGHLGADSNGGQTFSTTFDGHWGVYQPDSGGDPAHSLAIDLSTGRTYRKAALYGTLGDWVVIAHRSADTDSPDALTLTTPGSWPALGTLSLGDDGMLQALPAAGDLTLVASGAQLPSNSAGSPTAAAVTPDGRTLVGRRTTGDRGGTETVAYALPTMRKLWSLPTPQYTDDSVNGLNDAIVVLQNDDTDASTRLTALDVHTGTRVWQRRIEKGALVCALTRTQLVLVANDQLAFVDPANGRQTSFRADTAEDASGYSSCPGVVAGGVSGLILQTGDGDSTDVVQLATP